MDTLLVALRVALSLGAVLGLLWVLQRRLTRGSRGVRSADLVTVVGRQGLGQKASVVVVDIDGRRFVLGVTEQSVNVLHDGDAPVAEAVTESTDVPADAGFARSLRAVNGASFSGASFSGGAVNGGATSPVPSLRDRHARSSKNRLAGSILSPATWQQTAAALRQGR